MSRAVGPSAPPPDSRTGPAPAVLFARALVLRCPWCGRGNLFRTYFTLHARCPVCNALLAREDGYFLGAMAINLVAAELLVFAGVVALLIATWPTPPWTAIQVGTLVAAAVTPLLFFPWSRTLWLALDWCFRPPLRGGRLPDQPRPGERASTPRG